MEVYGSSSSIRTPLTDLLGINHPILLAGMAKVSGAPLAAAVSNAGGLGVIGGLGYTPRQLREIISDLKSRLNDPDLPFGVDLALPQIGQGARATNHDYTNGQLDELIEVVVQEGVNLFVSAVGVPPERVVNKLHGSGILIMNMVGSTRQAIKTLQQGVDMICAPGGEGVGHTGDTPTSLLIPAVVDIARKFKSPLIGERPLVVGAGGMYDGSGLASALMYGAAGIWVGTRFVASLESGASQAHKTAVVGAKWGDTKRTLVITGRPLRVLKNEYILGWEEKNKAEEMEELLRNGIVPLEKDLEEGSKEIDIPFLVGSVAPLVNDIKPAAEIIMDMIREANSMLRQGAKYAEGARKTSKL